MRFLKKYFGPSTLVTAAFIGPGTLTTCTIAGANFGYSLLWVLLFAVIATILLQEMAARLGLVTQKGLGEAIHSEITQPLLKWASVLLVFTAIIVGNAAYEAGNISGAVLGMEGITHLHFPWATIIGFLTFVILWFGKFRWIERILIGLVLIMSAVFIATAIMVKPDMTDVLSGFFIPSLTSKNQWTILALMGTTIVPYNLFLHASSVKHKWKRVEELPELRKENRVAMAIGGLISIAIVITSATVLFGVHQVDSVSDMANQLSPLLGNYARIFLAVGLFAAGISSAVTAPLAAAYTAQGIFGWKKRNDWKFKTIWLFILVIGTTFSLTGYNPIEVIQVAQVFNGILLPIIVFFLIYLSNKRSLMGTYTNKTWQNALAVLVIAISFLLSFRSLNNVFHLV